jgi:hypothetical protein
MLGNDINYIIKNINKRESSVINYIKKKNYNVNYVTSELSIYMDKCFYNAECIDESKSLLDKIGSNLVIEHLIEEIFNKIKNKIVSLNKKHKTNISDDNLKSAIKCLINFVLNPSKIFPLKDKTSISGDVTIYNLDYNTYLWGRLEQKCTFDSNNDEIISKLKKASVIENIKLLEKFKGLNADDAKLKVYPDDKKTLLHIAIEAFVDTFKNKFNFNPPIFDFDFENSGSDYKETTQTFNANSLGIESPKDTISISEVCGKLFPDNVFKADGKLTDECVAEIAKYVDDKCSSSLSPSRQISEINLNLENSQKCKKIILDKRSLNSTCGTKPVFETVDCRLRKITKFDKDQRIKTIRAKLPNLIRSSTISSNSINRLPPPVINLSTISAPVSQTGGKKKINILGRERRIINKNNKDYIRYKNELITLKEANKLNKLKNI